MKSSPSHCRLLILLLVGLMPIVTGCGSRPTNDDRGNWDGDVTEPVTSSQTPSTTARFLDRAADAGVRFVPRNGEDAGQCAILESLGVGVALFDYDGDGDLDLLIPGGGRFGSKPDIRGLPPALYRNDGLWRFTDVTRAAGLHDATVYSHGAAVADFDNDGFPDLLITGYGSLLLYHNRGDGTFESVAEQAGLRDKSWSTSAAWGDVNGDGVLDLYVVHYVDWSLENNPRCADYQRHREICSPTSFQALPDKIYLSAGDGTFRDISATAGLRKDGKGLAVLAADFDLDGDLDLYIANDTSPNFLYRNDGTGRFQEIGLMSGTALGDTAETDGSMGIAWGDFDLDGLPDLWVANYEDQNFALYRNLGHCTFQHVSSRAGIAAVGTVFVGFGTVFFDFDRDGDLDLFVADGHVMHFPRNAPRRQRPLLFENLAGERFVNVAEQAGAYCRAPHTGRGVAVGDIDNDGDLDLAVAHTNESVALLSNRSSNLNHWLGLRLIGRMDNRDAIGATVRVRGSTGEQIRQVTGGGSYLSTSDRRLFFGLGRSTAVPQITIRWPSGRKQTLTGLTVDQTHIIRE